MAWAEKYVSVAGGGAHDGSSEANAWTLAEAITNAAAGDRVNVIADVYANTTTSRTFATAGTTTAPVWWRGYDTAIGDMDGATTSHGTFASGVNVPAWTFTTGRVAVTGAHQIFSNIDVQGAFTTGGQWSQAVAGRLFRVKIENTNAAAASRAANCTAAGSIFQRCWLKATSTATSVVNATVVVRVQECTITGGGHGIDQTSAAASSFMDNIFLSVGGDGILVSAAGNVSLTFRRNTFYNCGGDGIEFSALPNFLADIAYNVFAGCTGSAINNSTGVDTNLIHRVGNLYYSNGSDSIGLGDSPEFEKLTDGSSPFVNAPTDLSIVSTSNGYNLGRMLAGLGYSTFADVGAVQHEDAGGGGGVSGSRIFTGM